MTALTSTPFKRGFHLEYLFLLGSKIWSKKVNKKNDSYPLNICTITFSSIPSYFWYTFFHLRMNTTGRCWSDFHVPFTTLNGFIAFIAPKIGIVFDNKMSEPRMFFALSTHPGVSIVNWKFGLQVWSMTRYYAVSSALQGVLFLSEKGISEWGGSCYLNDCISPGDCCVG